MSAIDVRFDAASATNDGAGRGWDFSPVPPRRYPVNLIRVTLQLLAGVAVISALWWLL